MIHFHKWVYDREGDPVTRKCSICGKTQELIGNYAWNYWETIKKGRGMHIHKWIMYGNPYSKIFMEEECTAVDFRYRQCSVCGRAQEFYWDSQGGSWCDLSPQELEIFNRKKSDLMKKE